MPPTSLEIEVHRVGPAETGGWCPVCSLPSIITVPLALVDPRSLRLIGQFMAHWCDSCGNRTTTKGR